METQINPSINTPRKRAPLKKLFKLTAFQMSQKLGYKNFSSPKAVLFMLLKKLAAIIVFTVIILFLFKKLVIGVLSYQPEQYFIGFLIAMLMIFSFVFSITLILNTLYYSGDNILLLSFAVSHNQVFLSKILYIWFLELYKSITFYLPIMIAFGSVSQLGASYFMMIPLYIAFATLIPTLLAAALSFPFMQLLRLIKSNSIIALIFFGAVISLVVYGFVKLSKVVDFGAHVGFLESFNAIYESTISFFKGVTKYSFIPQQIVNLMFVEKTPLSLLILFGFIIVSLLVISLAVRPLYFKMAISGIEHKSRANNKKTKENKINGNGLVAFVKKDLIILLRSPGVLFSFFLFLMLLPFIITIANLFLKTVKVGLVGNNILFCANFLLMTLIAMASNSYAATAISREGGNFYLTKSSPLSFEAQAKAKIFVNAIVSTPLILASCIMMIVLTQVSVVNGILAFVVISFLNIGHIIWSFTYDLEEPKLDWYDTGEATTENKNSSKSIILALILSVMFTLLFGLELFLENIVLMWVKLVAISVLFAVVRIFLLRIRLNYCYKRIEM